MAKTEIQKQNEALAKLAAQFGITEYAPLADPKDQEEAIAEAEGVLLFLQDPKKFLKRERACSHCEQRFIPLAPSVGYCSNHCRIEALKELGLTIDWNSKDPKERWGLTGTPLVLPPPVYEVLASHFAERAQEETLSQAAS